MNTADYGLFLEFIETFSKDGFTGIDQEHSLMLKLEEMMEENRQFFYIADMIQLRILFTSKGSTGMLGILPEELNLYHFMELTHPDDINRLSIGRSKVVKIGQDLFLAEQGRKFLSTDYRMWNPQGEYSRILVQCYFVYSTVPRKTVYFFKLHTNIDWHPNKCFGFHYYLGEDPNYFRYPDAEMLNTGLLISNREFQIVKLVEQGLSSEQIAEGLFLSLNTVNTHRSNILRKTGMESIADLIFSYKERGLM